MIAQQEILKVTNLLNRADAVLLGAGAGLSAAAGFNYLDEDKFAEIFPGWIKKGFSKQYELMGYPYWSQKEQWGYYKVHLNYMYFGPRSNSLYQSLFELIKSKDHFAMTSNVDGLFYKNGISRDRFYSPQGDYGLIQCTTPCSQEVWPVKPFLDKMEEAFDPAEQVLTSDSVVPSCPNCGGQMFIHARIDGSFIDTVHQDEYKNLMVWLEGLGNKRVLLLELGAGMNTPTVIRMPMEQIARALPNASLVRVNLDYSDLPGDLNKRGLPIKADIKEFIKLLSAQMN